MKKFRLSCYYLVMPVHNTCHSGTAAENVPVQQVMLQQPAWIGVDQKKKKRVSSCPFNTKHILLVSAVSCCTAYSLQHCWVSHPQGHGSSEIHYTITDPSIALWHVHYHERKRKRTLLVLPGWPGVHTRGTTSIIAVKRQLNYPIMLSTKAKYTTTCT